MATQPQIKENLSYKKDILLKSTSDAQLHEHEYLFQRTLFNPQGKVTLEEHYDNKGELVQKYVYEYDSNGYLREEMLVEADEFVAEHKSFERDDKGKIIKELRHYMDGSADTMEYTYDEGGRLIRKTLLDPDGEVENHEEFEWEGDLLVLHRIFDNEGELINEEKKVYDTKGQALEVILFNAMENLYTRTVNEYYESGNKKEVLVYNQADQLIEKILLQEDQSGNIMQVTEETRHKKNVINFEYDASGNVTFQEEFDKNGELVGQVKRKYNENNMLESSDVFIDGGGRGMSRSYHIRQEYLYF